MKKYVNLLGTLIGSWLISCIPVFASENPCAVEEKLISQASCNSMFTPEALDIIKEVLSWFSILAPILLIVLVSIDYAKAIMSHEQEAMQKANGKVVKRAIAVIGLFLVPSFVKLFLGMPSIVENIRYDDDPLCLNSAMGTKANKAIENNLRCSQYVDEQMESKSTGNLVKLSELNISTITPTTITPAMGGDGVCDGTSYYGSAKVAESYVKYYSGAYKGIKLLKCSGQQAEQAFAIIYKYCGTITHAGAMRSFSAKVTASRSATSFHYTGRAFDLNTKEGMRNSNTYFYVTLDNTSGKDNNHYYRLYCKATKSSESSPYVSRRTITPVYYSSSSKTKFRNRAAVTANFLDVTSVLNSYGFYGIGPRSCYKTNSMCTEWWHFQDVSGLVKGKTTFKQTLYQLHGNAKYPSNIRSKFNCRFSGLGFKC